MTDTLCWHTGAALVPGITRSQLGGQRVRVAAPSRLAALAGGSDGWCQYRASHTPLLVSAGRSPLTAQPHSSSSQLSPAATIVSREARSVARPGESLGPGHGRAGSPASEEAMSLQPGKITPELLTHPGLGERGLKIVNTEYTVNTVCDEQTGAQAGNRLDDWHLQYITNTLATYTLTLNWTRWPPKRVQLLF